MDSLEDFATRIKNTLRLRDKVEIYVGVNLRKPLDGSVPFERIYDFDGERYEERGNYPGDEFDGEDQIIEEAVGNLEYVLEGFDVERDLQEGSYIIKRKKKPGKRPMAVDYVEDLSALENIAKIVLTPFPEQQRAERISIKEIREKLSRIMYSGYPVEKDFRNMPRGDAWNHYLDIYRDIEDLTRRKLPEVYEEIKGKVDA